MEGEGVVVHAPSARPERSSHRRPAFGRRCSDAHRRLGALRPRARHHPRGTRRSRTKPSQVTGVRASSAAAFGIDGPFRMGGGRGARADGRGRSADAVRGDGSFTRRLDGRVDPIGNARIPGPHIRRFGQAVDQEVPRCGFRPEEHRTPREGRHSRLDVERPCARTGGVRFRARASGCSDATRTCRPFRARGLLARGGRAFACARVGRCRRSRATAHDQPRCRTFGKCSDEGPHPPSLRIGRAGLVAGITSVGDSLRGARCVGSLECFGSGRRSADDRVSSGFRSRWRRLSRRSGGCSVVAAVSRNELPYSREDSLRRGGGAVRHPGRIPGRRRRFRRRKAP